MGSLERELAKKHEEIGGVSGLTAEQRLLFAGSNAYSNPLLANNPYSLAKSAQQKGLNGSFFFDDVFDFDFQFKTKATEYANPDIAEEEQNRKLFGEFSKYMFYQLAKADDEGKGKGDFLKRKSVVKFNAQRKRFLNKMIKSPDGWSTGNMQRMLLENDWIVPFNEFKLLYENQTSDGKANGYSEALAYFEAKAGPLSEDEHAIHYTKEEFDKEKDWYSFGKRNHLTKENQFVLEQQLYNEFSLYVSYKQRLLRKGGDSQGLDELNKRAATFIDEMYGDAMNVNHWGQSKYFRLLNKFFPDYEIYLTDQRNIIKSGLTQVTEQLFQNIRQFIAQLQGFLSQVDTSREKLNTLPSAIEAQRSKMGVVRQDLTVILAEYAPEKRDLFIGLFDGLSKQLDEMAVWIQEKTTELGREEELKKNGLVVLDGLLTDLDGYQKKLVASTKFVSVEALIQPIAKLYVDFQKRMDELGKNLKFHSELDQSIALKNEEIESQNTKTSLWKSDVQLIKEKEILRRQVEINNLKTRFKQLVTEGIVTDRQWLLYDGIPENTPGHYSDYVTSDKQSDSDINVSIKRIGQVAVKADATDLVVDYLFGTIDQKSFETRLKELEKEIPTFYTIINQLSSMDMGGVSEKFNGELRQVYESATPEYYKSVIAAKSKLLALKPEIEKKYLAWQKKTTENLDDSNEQEILNAKNKKHAQILIELGGKYKTGEVKIDVLTATVKKYLLTNPKDVLTLLNGMSIQDRQKVLDDLINSFTTEELKKLELGLQIGFYELLNEGKETNGKKSGSTSIEKLKQILQEKGWNETASDDFELKEKVLEEALKFIKENPGKSSSLYGFAGYHKGVPGKPIDCSGLVSQCLHYAGGGYLNNVPTINGKKVTDLNGVGNIINQPNVRPIDASQVKRGDLVTMEDRVVYNGIEVGHIAFISSVKRNKEGSIIGLELYHSSGTKGPNIQYVDLTDPEDSYYKYVKGFNYWRFSAESSTLRKDISDPKNKAKELPQPKENKKNRIGYEFTLHQDASMPSAVDFSEGKKYIENLSETQIINMNAIIKALREGGITHDYDIAAILAIVSKESNLIPKNEKMSYSKERLPEVWGRFSKTGKAVPKGEGKYNYNDLAVQYEKKPEELANLVYGGSYGNDQPGDGYKYRGRAYNGITFKSHYQDYTTTTGVDLLTNPDKANEPDVAGKILVQYMIKQIGDIKKQNMLKEYGANGANDFKDLKNAVFAYYHCNTGLGKTVEHVKSKLDDKGGDMAKAQGRAPYFQMYLQNQRGKSLNQKSNNTTWEIPAFDLTHFKMANAVQDEYLSSFKIKETNTESKSDDEFDWSSIYDFNKYFDQNQQIKKTTSFDFIELDVKQYWVSQGKTFNCDVFARKVIEGQSNNPKSKNLYANTGKIGDNKTARENSLHLYWETEAERGVNRTQGVKYADDITTLVLDKHEQELAVEYIHACLESGIPALVGTNHTYAYKKAAGNADGTTDHWLVITGRGKDKRGNYFSYIDPGRSRFENATSERNNRLYQDASMPTVWKDVNAYQASDEPGEKSYTLVAVTLYNSHRAKSLFDFGGRTFDKSAQKK